MNVFEKIERLRASRPFRFHNFDNGRNDFASLLDHDRIADANVFAFDFILVVQCRAANRASADNTGSSIATGVRIPVRPTWITMSSSRVSTRSAAYLYAIAQRGDFAVNPSRSR